MRPGRSGSGRSTGSSGYGGSGATGRRGIRSGSHGPRRWRLILAGVLLLLLLEIIVLITVAKNIGVWWTLGLLILCAGVGAYLVRRESGRTWRALRGAVDTGRMPGRELADASLVLVGGLLLLLPGFLSDLVGIFFILPFTRTLSRRLLAVLIGSRLPAMNITTFPGAGPSGPGASGTGHAGPTSRRAHEDIIEGEIIDEEPPPQA